MALAPGDRVALLGANGMGKSTLMRGIAGRIAPGAGAVERSPDAKVGYFAQHRLDQLDPRRTLLELARAAAPGMREQEMRDFLGGFGFGAAPATSHVAPLSGGEKTRLALALLVLERPNLLLLDEPTNHLDLDMRQALALALQSYSGALVLVSHDRHLLRLVSDSLWLVAGARAAPFEGDLDDYRRWLSERPAVMFVRDEAAGSRPSGTVSAGGPGMAAGSPPSGTVATGGAGMAAGSPPSGTVATGGAGMAVRAAGECLPPPGADPFGGPPLTGDPRSGRVTPSAPRRRRTSASAGGWRRRSDAGSPRSGARSTRWSADWPLWARSGRRSRRPWQMPPSTTKRSARGCVGCSCAAGGSTRRSRKSNRSGSKRASNSTRCMDPRRDRRPEQSSMAGMTRCRRIVRKS